MSPETGRAPWRFAWPAYACAVALLAYAVGKAVYAVQGKLGLPGGVEVPPEAYQELGNVALRQWMLAGLGLAGALLALASVQSWGRRIPRWMMLTAMWGALVPQLAGAPVVFYRAMTGETGLFGGLQAVAGLALWAAAAVSFQRRTRRRRT
jgi:hypothetical protein